MSQILLREKWLFCLYYHGWMLLWLFCIFFCHFVQLCFSYFFCVKVWLNSLEKALPKPFSANVKFVAVAKVHFSAQGVVVTLTLFQYAILSPNLAHWKIIFCTIKIEHLHITSAQKHLKLFIVSFEFVARNMPRLYGVDRTKIIHLQ